MGRFDLIQMTTLAGDSMGRFDLIQMTTLAGLTSNR
jgi:hypothetical protein